MAASLRLNHAFRSGRALLRAAGADATHLSSAAGAPLLRRAPFSRLPRLRGFSAEAVASGASVHRLVTQVETALASGQDLNTDSALFKSLEEGAELLRADNDRILRDIEEVKKLREKCVAEEEQLIKKMHSDDEIATNGPQMAELLKQIEQADLQTAGLRSQQLENSKEISAIKRGIVRVKDKELNSKLLATVEEALDNFEPLPENSPVVVGLNEAVMTMRKEFDDISHAVSRTKKELENTISKIRSAELSLRVRRDTLSPEVDQLRATVTSHLLEAQRKNFKITRFRDREVQLIQEIGALQRAREKLAKLGKVTELMGSTDTARISAEMEVLRRELESSQEAVQGLEAAQKASTEQCEMAFVKLRALKNVVSPETGELREQLVASLREEEFYMSRLAIQRNTQALVIRFLGKLKAAQQT